MLIRVSFWGRERAAQTKRLQTASQVLLLRRGYVDEFKAVRIGIAIANTGAQFEFQIVLWQPKDQRRHFARNHFTFDYATEAAFRQAVVQSTLSETYLNYADLLASEGRVDEARQWLQKVLNKERTMPTYLRRRERLWFQRANELLKQLPA